MPAEIFELNPLSRIAVRVIGRPGQRTFFLQASDARQVVTVKLEKQQVSALARGIDEIIKELEEREVRLAASTEAINEAEVTLPEPVEVDFVVGQMGIAFDPAEDKMVLVIQELLLEMAEEEEGEPSSEDAAGAPKPSVARIWGSVGQMRTLSRQAKDLVAQGRPLCPLCQRPIDPEGHFCPRGNGHGKKIQED
jgi:uncharacterized repeat protein (TIGR03847 family)